MATPAYAGNGGTGTITASTTGTGAFAGNVTAGNCLICFVTTLQGVAASSITDTLGNLWIAVSSPANNALGGRVTAFFCNNSLGGANTITVTIGSSGTASFTFGEYSNVGSIASNRSIVDTAASATGNTTTPTLSAVPQQGGSLIVAGAGDIAGAQTYTAGSSMTARQTVAGTYNSALADKVGSTTSLSPITASFTITSAQWSIVELILRPSGTPVTNSGFSQGASAASLTSNNFTPKLGELMVVSVMAGTTGATVTSVSDSSGHTWTEASARATNGSGGELSVWWAFSKVSTATTFTANFSPNSKAAIQVELIAGVIPSASPIDVSAVATGNGTVVSVGPSGTPVIASEIGILFVGTPGTFGSGSSQGGSLSLNNSNSGANCSMLAASQVISSAATQTYTATLITSSQWSGILISVKTGGVSFVQSVSATSASAALNPAMPFNCTPGNTLIAAGMVNNHTGFSGVTGPAFTQFPSAVANNASGGASDIWYALAIAGGKVSPTAAATTVAKAVDFYEISGISAIDEAGTHTANDQAVAASAQPNFLFELAVLASGDVGTGKAYTATSPATIEQADVTTNVDLMGALMCQFTVGTVPPAITMAGSIPTAAVQHSDSLATFKVAGSPAYYSSTVSETAAAAETVSGSNAIHVTIPETSTASETVTSSNAIHILINEVSQAIESVTEFVVGLEGALLKVWAQVKTQLDIWSRKKNKVALSTQVKTQLDVWASKSGLATPGVKMDTLNFDQGDVANVYGSFTDPTTGNPVTPTTAYFVARRPDGSIAVRKHYPTDPEVHLVSTGFFRTEVDTSTLGGSYLCRYYAPPGDPYQASEQVTIYVASDTLV